jgi:hypothetical protein
MTKLLLAALMALGISTTGPVLETPRESVETVRECIAPEPEPEPMSCKASGHDCEDREDCCSRMCDKKKKKCG